MAAPSVYFSDGRNLKRSGAGTGIMRSGSREAVLATLAATVVIGMLLGRKR
jgi:hypothetical protein